MQRVQFFRSVSSTVPNGWNAAALTIMCSPPDSLPPFFPAAWTAPTCVTSHCSTCKLNALALASAASSPFAATSIPQARTFAPPAAKRLAIARPMPVVPVTTATFPSNSLMWLLAFVPRTSVGQFRECMLQSAHDAAEFRQPFHPAHQRISRIHLLADVIRQEMSVIGPHGNFVVRPSFAAAPHFFFHERTNYADHVRAAVKMLRFVKRPLRFPRHLPQMSKMNARGEFPDHGEQIIVRARPVGASTERQPIGRCVDGRENVTCVLGSRNPPWQAKEWPRRVVRGNRQADPQFVRHRDPFSEERNQMGAQVLGVQALVFRQPTANGIAGVGTLCARQAGSNRPLQVFPARLGHCIKTRPRGCNFVGSVTGCRVPARQNEEVIGGEVEGVKSKGVTRGGKPPPQVGRGPAPPRREVVAYEPDSRLPNVGQRILPRSDRLPAIGRAQLDGIVYRDALHHRPHESRGFDFRFPPEHFLERPRLAAIEVMQRRHNTGGARLLDLLERNRVLRPKPSPGFPHRRSVPFPARVFRSP